MEVKELRKKYEKLNDDLLVFCSILSKEDKNNEDKIIKVLDSFNDEQDTYEYSTNPPHDWLVENYEDDYILFNNGVFMIQVKKEGDKFSLTIESGYFGKHTEEIRFPFKKQIFNFDSVFEAMAKAINLQEELYEDYFIEEIDYSNEWIPFRELEKKEIERQGRQKEGTIRDVFVKMKCQKCAELYKNLIHSVDFALNYGYCSDECIGEK